jgi:predicted nicotinamide N-methyase
VGVRAGETMTRRDEAVQILSTTAGDFPLSECRLSVGEREWSVLHAAALVSRGDENHFLEDENRALPYGAALWSAAITLAHEVATRPAEFRGCTVLELGAGTGLPGVVAASLGASVVQTDRHELAVHLCRLNAERNGAAVAECRLVDWADWDDDRKYDWVIGADVVYSHTEHEYLRRIFEGNLAPGGRVLLADPYRGVSLLLLEELEASGWKVTHSRWAIGSGDDARPVAVYELSPPGGRP